MIITRTPYRVSFFGGGSDFPQYYEKYGGAALSCTINKYSYIHCRDLPPYFDHKYRLRYFQTERVNSLNDICHPSIRECLRFCTYTHGVEVLHSGDIPAMTGIGSSSSFTVGLLLALRSLQGVMMTKRQLALDAIHVEQCMIKEHVGSQDQYAAAFGGFNRFDFGPGKGIFVSPVAIKKNAFDYLQNNLFFLFSGVSRFSTDIQADFTLKIQANTAQLDDMVALVDEAQSLLNGGEERHIDNFGRLLHTAWQIKKSFSKKISSELTDAIYAKAMEAGALGGKVCGAGGGGFMMFYAQPEYHDSLKKALSDFLFVPVRMENHGAHIILYTKDDN